MQEPVRIITDSDDDGERCTSGVILNIEPGKVHSVLRMLSYVDSGFLPRMGDGYLDW